MRRNRIVIAVVILAVGVFTPTGLTELTKTDAVWAKKVVREADPAIFQRIPMLRPGLSEQERKDEFTQLDIGVRRMKRELQNQPNVPAEVNAGIRAWESLTLAQRERLMKGEPPQRIIAFTPVAALVVAVVAVSIAVARFVYDVGKDYSYWGKKGAAIQFREPTAKELDYIEKARTDPHANLVPMSPKSTQFSDVALNYQ